MNKILIFAGTTEGRELAEYLERQQISCHICVATEYGESLLKKEETIHQIHQGRLNTEEMEELIKKEGITLVVDATHPYAAVVSENIILACENASARYLRLLRKEQDVGDDCVFVESVSAAVDYLAGTTGGILAATGSKELKAYTALPDYKERVFARILSTKESMEIAASLGFQGKNLICMQGPFSEELNIALLNATGANFLVTKESGKTGGFPEKLSAARKAGATLVVVGRPQEKQDQENVFTESSIRAELLNAFKIRPKRQIKLAGIGMGSPENMTLEVAKACEEADLLIGAGRMLEVASNLKKPVLKAYLPDEIRNYIENHPEYEKIVILMSGDVGFYSGARKLLDRFPKDQVELYGGISSVVYLCARLATSWDDVKLISLHGRSQNLIGAVKTHRKIFALVGKQESFRDMLQSLLEYGYDRVRVSVGCALSYPEEEIFTGTPEELMHIEVGDLTAVLIENPQPNRVVTHGLDDEQFIRTKVPMTKSEIRSISISKLVLEKNSIIYDVGAGTGSVSVEMALQAVNGMVYAIEKNPEAVELIGENRLHFGAANLQVIEGLAPDALAYLPAPTHAFIGGSSGNLRQILELLLQKNPHVRIVINAIALETVAEAAECLKALPFKDIDICTVNVAKSRSIGKYHMMMGQNPVTIFTAVGAADDDE